MDPQKYFIITTSSLSKAACHMSYIKTRFTEGWVVTFKPHSTSTLRVTLSARAAGEIFIASSVASSINERINILMLDYWTARRRRNQRKVSRGRAHVIILGTRG